MILFINTYIALLMGNVQKTRTNTRHMTIKNSVLLDWVQFDLLIMKAINKADIQSDSMTKALRRTLQYRYFNYILGREEPKGIKKYECR